MKGKKLLSMLTVGALAVTTVMPVMAADDGGEFEVGVTTKTGVVRVEVPTSMAIAVDQFEITHTGTQIAAGEFNMTNKSEMDVKVTITSTATLGTGVNLVSTAKAAEDSTGADAWLGVAAKTNDGSANSGKVYDDLKTGTDADAKVEEFWELTDANANVTSFAADTKKAEQTFYLAKGSGNATYKLAVPDALTQVEKTFAKFYELTEDSTITDDDTLASEVAAKDVYVVAAANIGNDGEAVTKIEKGSAAGTFDGTNNKYYTAAEDASTPATGKIYVYASMATDGGKAGFTYIGKLGGKETWTKTDIAKIKVAYEITGVTATRYNEVVDDCTYGLYTASAEPSIALNGTYSRANAANVFDLADVGSATITKVEALNSEGEVFAEITSAMYTVEGTSLKVDGSKAPWGAGAVGQERGIKVTLSNGKTVQATFRVNA